MTWLDLFAALITAYSVWLTARESIWCWPTGVVSVILYASIFWRGKFYANAWLQIIYLVLIIYGWYQWRHGGRDDRELPVSRMPLRGWLATLGLGVAATVITALAMRRWTDAAMPLLDAGTTAFSIAAEAMTTRKWIENWPFWIVIDVVTTYMLVPRASQVQTILNRTVVMQHPLRATLLAVNLYANAVLYASFVVLAVVGWIKWRKSLVSA